jgi:hypothetical protein
MHHTEDHVLLVNNHVDHNSQQMRSYQKEQQSRNGFVNILEQFAARDQYAADNRADQHNDHGNHSVTRRRIVADMS